jgi:hypothetical protein
MCVVGVGYWLLTSGACQGNAAHLIMREQWEVVIQFDEREIGFRMLRQL